MKVKRILELLVLVNGVYNDVMFSMSTLTRGNDSSTIDTLQNLFLTGFYNGMQKSQAMQEQVLPQSDVVHMEQQVEQQIKQQTGQQVGQNLMDKMTDKVSSVADKLRVDTDGSLEKLAKTDVREALLKEDIFSVSTT